MTSRAYVFIDGLENNPVICGVVELDPKTNIGKFRYGQSYLQRDDAFPLDPLHLPLLSNQFITRVNKGMFGAILDKTGAGFFERCSMCGECVLNMTGGICPVTRCAKSLLNGPCGGSDKGKCEVDKDKDCAWILIYNRLKELGEPEKMKAYRQAKDYSKTTRPRHIIVKE